MRRSRSAFTLVELLVVIAIIALLISILLPALSRAREAANRVACLSNIRQLSTAIFSYTNDSKGRYPGPALRPGFGFMAHDWLWWRQGRDITQSPIMPYLGSKTSLAVLRCPSDNIKERMGSFGEDYPYSYCINVYLAGQQYGFQRTSRTSEVKRSSEKVLIAEEDERSINDGAWWPGQQGDPNWGYADLLSIRHDRKRVLPDTGMNNATRYGNIGFCDGHGEYVTRAFAHDQNHWDPAK